MHDILLHPSTKLALEQAFRSSHHAFALLGPYGAGKGYLASKLASNLLGPNYRPQQILRLAVDGPIGIEEIRSLTSFLRLKTTGTDSVRRVIIIEDAQTLTLEAQNALLKTLEEPPEDTRIILTVTDTTSLRQTVYSRLHIIHIQACPSEQVYKYFEARGYDKQAIQKAYLLSRGYAGLCEALLKDDDHALSYAINQAKTFLTSSLYQRLSGLDTLSKDKEKVALLLFAIKRVISAAAKSSKNDSSIKSMTERLRVVYLAERSLRSNPNLKLLLTNLSLQL